MEIPEKTVNWKKKSEIEKCWHHISTDAMRNMQICVKFKFYYLFKKKKQNVVGQ